MKNIIIYLHVQHINKQI